MGDLELCLWQRMKEKKNPAKWTITEKKEGSMNRKFKEKARPL